MTPDPDELFPVDSEPDPDTAPDPGDDPPVLDTGALQIDAPLEVKDAHGIWMAPEPVHPIAPGDPRPTANVVLPGQAATNAAGSRAPRRAAAVAAPEHAGARHNWIPTGPRNVGGRVRALAIHPTDPRIMYAGPASGGVHKSVDGGESWFALWHDEPSLAIGAIAICRADPRVVWVATGEVRTGGAEIIRGNGIHRSADDGANWVNPIAPPVFGTPPMLSFDAIAAHPTQTDTAWAVGPAGIVRISGTPAVAEVFAAGRNFTDVAFSQTAAGNPILYLLEGSGRLFRLDNPAANAAAITAALALAANRSVLPAAVPAGPAPPFRGKLAICAGNRNIAYLRLASAPNAVGRNVHLGVWRTRNARAATASAITWTQLRDHGDWPQGANPNGGEGQGDYNLSIAVDPANANNVATGMVELYLSRNANAANPANVRWRRAMAWDLYHLDRAHHADNHGVTFAPQPGAAAGAPNALWTNNDGGISRSTDWNTGDGYPLGTSSLPLPARVMTWRKRSHGISASQMYDLTQSPLVPSMFACGFQDNGIFLTLGSLSWRLVLGADGGFIAFDPDDPYRFLATWQGGIAEVVFPGTLEGRFPLPGEQLLSALWPRTLTQGFLPPDGAAFVAETQHHPRAGGSVLHARVNRLYGRDRAQGDRFAPEEAGSGLELLLDTGATTSTLTVLPSAGARRLGLVPQTSREQVRTVNPQTEVAVQRRAIARVRSSLPGPYALQDGDQLLVDLDGARTTITFAAGAGIADLARASTAEVAARVRAVAGPRLRAHPVFWARPLTVTLTTRDAGPAASITLGGDAPPDFGLVARAYNGEAGRPATLDLIAIDRDMSPVGGVPRRLTIQIGAGPVRTLDFAAADFANLASLRNGELARVLRRLLAADPVDVTAFTPLKRVRLTATAAGAGIVLGGTAVGATPGLVPAAPAPAASVIVRANGLLNRFDATPGGSTLTINDGVNPATATVTFTPSADIPDMTTMTAEEVRRLIAAALTASGVAVTADIDVAHLEGEPKEVVFAPGTPGLVWAGGEDGRLHRRNGDGAPWQAVTPEALREQDRAIEAIAIDPRDANRVFAGLEGLGNGAGDPGMLFRTLDGGRTWDHVGADLKDGAGALVGIHALEIDPDVPERVYAATDAGVFRSTDGGDHWQPFNENLPNAPVRDLAFSPATRMLRAGAWGRGTFERHVGDRPPADVRLYVRTSELDQGVRPVPRGPAGLDRTPRGMPPGESPDIKVARSRPPRIGADELVDGVEFDEDIRHEDPAPGPALVFVQVHNRGAFPATSVRKVALWADAGDGPPPLPADFWTRFAAGALAGDVGAWRVIGDATLTGAGPAGQVAPGYPRVHTFDGFAWPADLDALRRVGILLLVSAAEDPLAGTSLDVAELLASEPRVAYRESATVRAADDARVLLRSTTPTAFTVSAPATGTAAALGFGALPVGPVTELLSGAEPFNLAPGTPQALQVTTPPQVLTVTFTQGPEDVANLAAASPREVAGVLNRELLRAGMRVRCLMFFTAGAGSPIRVELRGIGATRLTVTGGTAAPVLGFTVGGAPVAARAGVAGLYALPAAATLTISAAATARIELPQGPDALPAPLNAARARDVRRVLNRAFAVESLPLEAVVPHVALWVRRSVTDVDGRPVVPAGRHLADLVAEPAAVAAAPPSARRDLFDLVRVHGTDRLKPGVQNFLYLRASNAGTAPQRDARHRLWRLDMTASPITATPVAGPATTTIPPGGSGIVELPWNPGALAEGAREFVLAVCDHPADRPLAVPAAFASLSELDAFCDRNPNAAYREFVVAA